MSAADEKHSSGKTAEEYYAIVAATHALEAAIVAPAPGREREWRRRAARELSFVIKFLKAHCASAERRNGILTEVEAEIGRTRELTLARREHSTLVRDASTLFSMLVDKSAEYADLRERVHKLIAALRRHQAREADLIYLAFQRDIGSGD